MSRALTSFAEAKDIGTQPRVRELLLSSRRWRTRCSSPITRASPRMGSRISTHRPPPNFSFFATRPAVLLLRSPKSVLSGFAKGLNVSSESPGESDLSMFQAGDAVHLFLSSPPLHPVHLTADTHVHTYRFLLFSISLSLSRRIRALDVATIYIPWYLRQVHACLRVAEDTACVPTRSPPVWVLHLYMYVRVAPIVRVFVPYPVEQRRWGPTSDRWYNWTGRSVLVSFLGLHSWNPFVSTHHSRLYYQLKNVSVALYGITFVPWVWYFKKLVV